MIKLKSLKFINFCGFKNFEIDLSEGRSVKKWLMLFGPNGSFKTSFLHGLELMASPWQLQSRLDNTLFFRRLTYHPNYVPGLEGFDQSKTQLYMEAIFDTGGGDKKIVLQNTWEPETTGVIINEFPQTFYSIVYNPHPDNPMNTQGFQIAKQYKEQFLDFARAVYGFDCEVPEMSLTVEYDSQIGNDVYFYTDFIITKYNNTKVHYRCFSAGEKKIATLISMLFNKMYSNENREAHSYENNIIVIDNIMLHLYYTRHMTMINKLDEFFPDYQIIASTHSPIVIEGTKTIQGMDKKYLINMEEYING